jgi:hypothetical protein
VDGETVTTKGGPKKALANGNAGKKTGVAVTSESQRLSAMKGEQTPYALQYDNAAFVGEDEDATGMASLKRMLSNTIARRRRGTGDELHTLENGERIGRRI